MHVDAAGRRQTLLLIVFGFLTVLFLLWPCYRSFLNVEIDINEGWNAYFADAAWGRMPLYPDSDQLITNNYPPLSFYFVGGVGQLLQDNILAGRLISIASLLVLAWTIIQIIRQLGGSHIASLLGSLFFIATMCRFYTGYVGMNDPQLFAQAVMAAGLLLFLRAVDHNTSLIAPILIMVLAGFIKHNIIAMPMTAFLWLAIQQPRRFPLALLFGLLAAGAGLLLCKLLYGPAFFANLFAPRIHDWRHAFGAIGHLQWVSVGLALWIYVGIVCRSMRSVQFCNLFVVVSLITFFLQKMGEGVAHNAMFDLVLAVSLAIGMTYELTPHGHLTRWFSPALLRNLLIVAICCRLLISFRVEPYRLLVDPSFYAELKQAETHMQHAIEKIKVTPGDVAGSTYACYRAGKPFVIDPFGISQRIQNGSVPENLVKDRIRNKSLTMIHVKQMHD